MHVTSLTIVSLLGLVLVVVLYRRGSFGMLWQAASGQVTLA